MIKKIFAFLPLLVLVALPLQSQPAGRQPLTSGPERIKLYQRQLALESQSEFRNLHWQLIGPTNISGRCTDVEAVRPKGENYTIWVASASGGVWKTDNEGVTWTSVFDKQVTTDIGDIAIDPSNPDIVWVGTGEANIFRSSMAGCGIYKTTDGGKTWKNMGLEDTHTIARILIHPKNSRIIYVAAGGREWTTNPERGVYKSVDAGATWEKILYVNDMTGAYDLVMDPSNPDILYAATWQRIRERWNDPRTKADYSGSGIWKSTDGGKSWAPINQGLPEANKRGRIGIDIALSNPNVLYAFLDNYETAYQANPGDLDAYGRQKQDIIKGATLYRSDDRGASWTQVSGLTDRTKRFMEGHSGTYGWVFGQVRVDPTDENTVYTLGLYLNKSTDGGRNFERETRIHMDHHGLWIDPENPAYLLSANDGGVNVSYDGGKNWKHYVDIPVVQFYNIGFSHTDPFHVYGSVQDHFSFRGLVDLSRGRDALRPVEWESAPGGEGCTHVVDPRDPNVLYSAQFYGNLNRSVLRQGRWNTRNIQPKTAEGEPVLRGEWVAPFILSPHNPDVVYHGMQYVFRSNDRGSTWEKISPDLTHNNPDKQGDISYQTITSISESPIMAGLIYAGTDDGRLHVTRDGGQSWTEIGLSLAPDRWISRVIASQYVMGRVYVTQNGKRNDDFQVYIWKSDDYGQTWQDIGGNIPLGPVNVIREDPFNPSLIYTGTDIGVYASRNQGTAWQPVGDLPSTYVHDLVIHPVTNMMIIATHGRGMLVLDANPINRK
ncbi:MAG: hypothetical protein R6V75_02260 [Bacteroidales bacterium]